MDKLELIKKLIEHPSPLVYGDDLIRIYNEHIAFKPANKMHTINLKDNGMIVTDIATFRSYVDVNDFYTNHNWDSTIKIMRNKTATSILFYVINTLVKNGYDAVEMDRQGFEDIITMRRGE